MNGIKRRATLLVAFLGMVLCAGLLVGCEDLSKPDDSDGPRVMPTTSLQAVLSWLDSNAADGWYYTIVLNADESIAPKMLSYKGKKVGIILKGDGSERTVSLSSVGSLFTVGNGVKLMLEDTLPCGGGATIRLPWCM